MPSIALLEQAAIAHEPRASVGEPLRCALLAAHAPLDLDGVGGELTLTRRQTDAVPQRSCIPITISARLECPIAGATESSTQIAACTTTKTFTLQVVACFRR